MQQYHRNIQSERDRTLYPKHFALGRTDYDEQRNGRRVESLVVSNLYEEYWVCPRVETKSFYDMQIAPDPAKWIATYCDKNSSIGMFMS